MRLRHIEVFQVVYISGSMTQAAKLLNVTQPSISKVLSHAEMQLGFKLFERANGRIVPTQEADRLFEHTSRVFGELQQVKLLANNLKSASDGGVRIACTPALGVDFVPTAIATVMRESPNAHFFIETMHYSEMSVELHESRIDLLIAFDPPSESGFVEKVISTGNFVVIAPADTKLNKQSVSIDDIADQPFIRLSQKGPLGQLLDSYIERSSTEVNEIVSTETYHVAKSLVAKGAGVSIVDEVTAYSALEKSVVKVFDLVPEISYRISVVYRENHPLSTLASRFVEALSHEMNTIKS